MERGRTIEQWISRRLKHEANLPGLRILKLDPTRQNLLMTDAKPKKRKFLVLKIMLLLLGLGIGYVLIRVGPTAYVAWKKGMFTPQMRSTYDGSTDENLKNLRLALMMYQDSEGQLPDSTGWMDAAWIRTKTADLTEDEARKKFRVPGMIGDDYGYAMNKELSQKYGGDLPQDTILLFDSKDLKWNASGKPADLAPSPARPGGNKGITLGGKIVELK